MEGSSWAGCRHAGKNRGALAPVMMSRAVLTATASFHHHHVARARVPLKCHGRSWDVAERFSSLLSRERRPLPGSCLKAIVQSSGSVTVSRTPLPGVESMARVPPASWTAMDIRRSPNPRGRSPVALISKPLPLSVIVRRMPW